MRSMIIMGASAWSDSAASYIAPGYNVGLASRATEANISTPLAAAGSIDGLFIKLGAAPGAGKSVTITVRKNGADTGVAVTISGASDTSGSSVSTAAFSAGDLLSLSIVPSGTPTTSALEATARFDSTTADESNLCGNSRDVALDTTATEYVSVRGGQGPNTETLTRMVVPTAGTIKKLYVALSAAPGAAKTRTFTLVKNGSDQLLLAAVTGTDTTASELGVDVTVAAGDTLSLKSTSSGTPASATAKFGFVFLASTSGESLVTSPYTGSLLNTQTRYSAIDGGVSFNAIESQSSQSLGVQCTLKKFYIILSDAPTAGKSWAFDVRVNGASPSSDLAITVADAATTGNDTSNTVAVADNDQLGVRAVPTSTPAALDNVRFSFVAVLPDAAVGPASLKTWDGLAKASVKTIDGLALASVKTWNGLA